MEGNLREGGKGNNRYIKETGFVFSSAQICCMGGRDCPLAPSPGSEGPEEVQFFCAAACIGISIGASNKDSKHKIR